MPCIDCGRGFHEDCDTNCEDCHPVIEEEVAIVESLSYKDPKSTGRKEAAKLYPIICRTCSLPTTRINRESGQCECGPSRTTDPCEWQGKKNCGGGSVPITGCADGTQVDRHHGPIKSPIRNHVGNVHRLCSKCHQRWHTLNDPGYDEQAAELQRHEPELATLEEIFENEMRWVGGWFKEHYDIKSNRKVVSD